MKNKQKKPLVKQLQYCRRCHGYHFTDGMQCCRRMLRNLRGH